MMVCVLLLLKKDFWSQDSKIKELHKSCYIIISLSLHIKFKTWFFFTTQFVTASHWSAHYTVLSLARLKYYNK